MLLPSRRFGIRFNFPDSRDLRIRQSPQHRPHRGVRPNGVGCLEGFRVLHRPAHEIGRCFEWRDRRPVVLGLGALEQALDRLELYARG
jgi:hypothetical protein